MREQPGEAGEEIIYAETIRYGIWLPLMILLLIAIFTGVAVIAIVKGGPRLILIVTVVVTASLILVYLNFRRLFFEITKDHVRFGFGLVKKEFRRSDITSCEPYELTFKNYLGYGIRYGRDGTVAYNTRNGNGVKMVVDGRKRPYVISVDDPERVCELLGLRAVARFIEEHMDQ